MFDLRYRCSSCQSRNVCLPACIDGSSPPSDLPSVSVVAVVICAAAALRWVSLRARHCSGVSAAAEGTHGRQAGDTRG